jgi:hypothetical protein
MTTIVHNVLKSVLVVAAGPSSPPTSTPRARRGPGPEPLRRRLARRARPYDLTGYWVALVTDDWRYRMITPPKGNVDYIPVTPEAIRMTDTWDPDRDEKAGDACRGYGAGGIMRLPTRLHVTWDGDDVLKLETDTGTQTRRFQFGTPPAPTGRPTFQGHSVARWEYPPGRRGGGPPSGAQGGRGQMKVTTTRMRPGYLRKNGVPYSGDAVLTEYFVRLVDRTGQEYLVVTTMMDDPQYLSQPYVKSYEFKKEADASGWNPTPCSAK